MKIKEGCEMRELCGNKVVVGHGDKNIDFSKVIRLNASGALIWQEVCGREFSVEEIEGILVKEYEVDAESAHADAVEFVDMLRQEGVIDE